MTLARPKPPEPLQPRSVRLTDRQWAHLRKLGSLWLRKLLDKQLSKAAR